jgi:hypothetical protein
MIRRIARFFSVPLIWLMKPIKLFAYQTRLHWLRRIILEITSFLDFLMVFANVQNATMQLHYKVYEGNFIFGKSVMVVNHAVAEQQIAQTTLRGNRFMGVEIVSNDPGAFVSNAGPINTGYPVRRLARDYIDQKVMTDRVRAFDSNTLQPDCAEILDEWSQDAKMASMWSIRGVVTRLFIQILAGKTLGKKEADDITFNYVRRFAEFTLFGGYLPFMLGILGTREGVRRDAFIPLRRHGIDNMIIDMTLFAAMFSIGTIIFKCIEFTAKYTVDYRELNPAERMQFVIESFRIYPTVTSVHRIVEADETIEICGQDIKLTPGSEVAYPFVCINRDPDRFSDPEEFRLHRSPEEFARVLSWSTGPHVCPAKDLSILATVMILDTLAERYDLRNLRIFNIEF